MMLAEEDAFEAEPVDMLPVGDAPLEDRIGQLWPDILTGAARRIQELEDPRPDHAVPIVWWIWCRRLGVDVECAPRERDLPTPPSAGVRPPAARVPPRTRGRRRP